MELTQKQRNVLCNKRWRSEHKDHVKQYGREYARKWRAANPEKNKAKQKRGSAKYYLKIKGTAKLKLNNAISVRMRKSLQGAKKSRRWEDLTGYTIEKLKKHLERKFTPEMSWENFGTYWHLDHKIPIAAFNYTRPEDIDFKKCWALRNLQPLEANANRSKSDSLEKSFQPSLTI